MKILVKQIEDNKRSLNIIPSHGILRASDKEKDRKEMLESLFNEFFSWIMLFVILLNISQRKIPHSDGKRKASLLIAVDFLIIYVLVIMCSTFSLPGWTEWAALALGIAVIVIFRRTFWPFRIHCRKCGKRMDFNGIIGGDDNLCRDCYYEKYPEEKKAEEEKRMTPQEKLERSFKDAEKVEDIDWDRWEPTETCVLTYVTDGDRILMIEKKTGLGSGYINAPGGHIEIEETKTEAAIRETKEETGLDVGSLEERAVLRFQFKDGLRMLGYVFFTSEYSGTMIDECEETKPFWTDIATLDYSRMWEDDRLWLPLALEGKKVDGYFIFSDLAMIDSKVVESEEIENEYGQEE